MLAEGVDLEAVAGPVGQHHGLRRQVDGQGVALGRLHPPEQFVHDICFKNGILPIKLPQEEVDKLMDDASRGANAIISVDLEKQEIRGPDGGCIRFEIDAFRKHCLLNGLDDIGLTMQKAANIDSFETKAKVGQPWLW